MSEVKVPQVQMKKPDHIKIPAHLSRKDMGDIASLSESIAKNGQLQPIGIDKNDSLIFGSRRLEAVKALGLEWVVCHVIPDGHDMARALLAEFAENEDRKAYTTSERVDIGLKIEESLKVTSEVPVPKGAVKAGSETVKLPVAKDHVPDQTGEAGYGAKGYTKEALAAAKAVGLNKETYAKAKKVVEAAKDDPTLADVVEEMNKTGKVSKAVEVVEERKTKAQSLKDAAGVEIPALLRDVFGDKKWLIEAAEACELIAKDLERVARAVQSKGPAYPWMLSGQILETLRGVKDEVLSTKELIEGGKPHVVCGECGGKGKVLDAEKVAHQCNDCRGCGWMPKHRYEELYDV